jgi:RNA polymerase sigma-70 factor (ECF subfamily)
LPSTSPRRVITYCIVPEDLIEDLHEPLRRHFADDASVEVIAEQRWRDRRRRGDRRRSPAATGALLEDRRRILGAEGRRVADRRAVTVVLDSPVGLPRRARAHAQRLLFVERAEPSSEQLEDHDTARLVARFQAGDGDVFATLYLRYFDRVYGYLRVLMTLPEEAEDATQQVFAQAFEALPRYERRAQPFRAWLFTIVRNYGVQQLRKQQRVEPVEPALLADRIDRAVVQNGDGDAVLDWISDRELLLFIERLPLVQRQILVLRYMLDLSTADIARVLGRSPDAVRRAQSRAVSFLRERLGAVHRQSERGAPERARAYVRQARVVRGRRFALVFRGATR